MATIINKGRPKSLCKCENCLNDFLALNAEINRGRAKFCSRECHIKFVNKKSIRFGASNPHWKGGKRLRSGYVWVKNRSHPFCDSHGYVREHRLVMEKHLGRLLDPLEVVHHKNRIRNDNRIENLQIFNTNAAHIRNNCDHIGRQKMYISCVIPNCQNPLKSHGRYCSHHHWLLKEKPKIKCRATKRRCIHS